MSISRREFLYGTGTAMALAGRSSSAAVMPPPHITDLRCEDMPSPMGLQARSPRLTWKYGSVENEYAPTHAEIQVRRQGSVFWRSERVTCENNAMVYSGPRVPPHDAVEWRVRTFDAHGASTPWSSAGRWQSGPHAAEGWHGAQWIAHDVVLEGTETRMPGSPGRPPEPSYQPAPYFRREFTVKADLAAAYLYVCGLGFVDVHVNNGRVDPTRERDPGFTNFDRSCLYITHDLTASLHTGVNALGMVLGTGWFDVHDVATWHFNTSSWRARPRMIACLALRYADGTQESLVSDRSWQTRTGPILRDGIYTGEIYDARLELPGWAGEGAAARGWQPALMVDAPHGALRPLVCEPIRVQQTLMPVSVTEPVTGTFVVDFGQNIAGHARLRLADVPAGTRVTMRYSERLDPSGNGMIWTQRIDHFMMDSKPRQPFQQDMYLAKGGGLEEWEQRFSYSGFQYVELTGLPYKVRAEDISARVANTALEAAGEFHCSDAIANAVHEAALRSYRSNVQSIPTDCPHREKNGWTGDVGLAAECGLMNFQSAAFYEKWLQDVHEAQRADGGFPVLIPNGGWGNGEAWPGPLVYAWDAAYFILLWQRYRYTSNADALHPHLQTMRRYLDFMLSHRSANGLAASIGLGDWQPHKTVTPLNFVNTAYQFLMLDYASRIASICGDHELQEYADRERAVTSAALQAQLYHPETHTYANGSQCAQAMALHFGFCPEAERQGVFAALVADLELQGHLDVGALGAAALFRALSEGGRTDLAFRIAMRREEPGYGNWIARGSTTLWEDWQGRSSLNHIMFGDISAWLQHWIAGLQPGEYGWKRFAFRPYPLESVTEAACSHVTPWGRAAIAWKRSGQMLRAEVEIPSGTEATVFVPEGASLELINGKRVASPTLKSGRYTVVIRLIN